MQNDTQADDHAGRMPPTTVRPSSRLLPMLCQYSLTKS
jgi:hypothetical protein